MSVFNSKFSRAFEEKMIERYNKKIDDKALIVFANKIIDEVLTETDGKNIDQIKLETKRVLFRKASINEAFFNKAIEYIVNESPRVIKGSNKKGVYLARKSHDINLD